MFNKILKDLRKSQGLSQKELADKTGISVHTINSYESGRREPNNKNLQILEQYFQVSRGFLLGTIKPNDFFEDQSAIQANLDLIAEQIIKLKNNMRIAESHQNKIATTILLKTIDYINKDILCHLDSCFTEEDIFSFFNSIEQLNTLGKQETLKRIEEMSMIETYRSNK